MEEGIKQYYISLGISKEFIESKNEENLHIAKHIMDEYIFGKELTDEEKEIVLSYILENLSIAKEIVEGYNFGRELTAQESEAIVKAILSPSQAKKRPTVIRNLVQNLSKVDNKGKKLTKKKVCGAIINLAINEAVNKYGYTKMLNSSKYVEKFVGEHTQNKAETDLIVTEATIQRAVAYNLSKEDEEQLIAYCKGLGVSDEFVKEKDIRNLYAAKQIIEGYRFEREFTNEEKCALLQCILKNVRLNKESLNRSYLSIFMQRLEDEGIQEQDRYRIFIKLAAGEQIVPIEGMCISLLFKSAENITDMMEYADEIDTEVTEDTIKRAKRKAIRMMQDATKRQRRSVTGIDEAGKALRQLETAEFSEQEIPVI
ncbi:MAG: hypothetical protein FWC68_02030 [Oscillospiraceae bacterium]|nr:hypothetical protein [Oscillospiraceae bacterium]